MPMYDLGCTMCDNTREVSLSIHDPLPPCPMCGYPSRRFITRVPGVSLKGGNWAQDGYSSTSMGEQARSDQADRNGRIVSFPGQRNKGTRERR